MDNNSQDLLKRAMQCRELGEYSKAQEYLDRLIEVEPENHLLWYEKSKLPILQEDTIIINSRTLSMSIYQRLSLPDKSNYLQQCGFGIEELPDVESNLSVPLLVENQRIKYLKMAIIHAPEQEKIVYMAELNSIIHESEDKGRKAIKATVSIGIISLLATVTAAFVFNTFRSAAIFQTPINLLILLLIPYALSVTGMVLYTKAKNLGNSTVIGLVCNLIALIISNLSIVNAIFPFFIK